MAAGAFLLAYVLRLGDNLALFPMDLVLTNTILFTAIAAIVYQVTGLYRTMWRYTSVSDLLLIGKVTGITILIYYPTSFVITRLEGVPRSLFFIDALMLVLMLGAPRIAFRLLKEGRFTARPAIAETREQVLLVGGGDEVEAFIRATRREVHCPYEVIGIIDTLSERVGYQIHGVPVVGSVEDNLSTLIAKFTGPPLHVRRMIATNDLKGSLVRHLVDLAAQQSMTLSRLPSIMELRAGNRFELRPIDIADLLNRPQANLDIDGMRNLIQGKRVLVTGAGGSIGSELVRQVASFGPAAITLLENNEFSLYTIEMEIRNTFEELHAKPVLCDVRDAKRLQQVFSTAKPNLVFHAAALKHVPMVEMNPLEGILTNVHGTRNVANACRDNQVSAMVLISTDKAVNPTNIMGATKRAAECYCSSMDLEQDRTTNETEFITVRFGNVLGSKGSVVPLFENQLRNGGPITVTHPDIERYFMTIREAVELVLQAAVLRCADNVGEGKLYVLDMGEPVLIRDLARQMILLAGLRPGEDIEIAFTGLRVGEKLHEELFHDAEKLIATDVESIHMANPRVVDNAVVAQIIDTMVECVRSGRSTEAVNGLRKLVPEYEEPKHHQLMSSVPN